CILRRTHQLQLGRLFLISLFHFLKHQNDACGCQCIWKNLSTYRKYHLLLTFSGKGKSARFLLSIFCFATFGVVLFGFGELEEVDEVVELTEVVLWSSGRVMSLRSLI